METITRHAQEIDPDEKRIYESLLGHELRANQQIILQFITLDDAQGEAPATTQPAGTLPDYCNVFDGLSDKELDELDELILDRSPSRSHS